MAFLGKVDFGLVSIMCAFPKHIHFYFILSSEINAYQKQIKVISVTSEMI